MGTTGGERFLRGFHARWPGVTGETLGRGCVADGRTGYEVLRDEVRGSRRVLDLGCGDGVLLDLLARDGGRHGAELAGVDLSPEALALAAERPSLAGATLRECRAQSLPLADGSFDACVSHMALMLMDEVDEVAGEVARVLVPGGRFACVVGGGAVGGEAYEVFLDLLRPALRDVPEERRMPVLGDRRTRTREGLEEVLGGAGFGPIEDAILHLDLSGPAERVWSAVSSLYDVATLEAAALADLKEAFLAEAAGLTPEGGPTPCAMKVRVAAATRG